MVKRDHGITTSKKTVTRDAPRSKFNTAPHNMMYVVLCVKGAAGHTVLLNDAADVNVLGLFSMPELAVRCSNKAYKHMIGREGINDEAPTLENGGNGVISRPDAVGYQYQFIVQKMKVDDERMRPCVFD